MALARARHRSLGLGCVALLALAACGGGEDTTPNPAPTAGTLSTGGRGGSSGTGSGGTLGLGGFPSAGAPPVGPPGGSAGKAGAGAGGGVSAGGSAGSSARGGSAGSSGGAAPSSGAGGAPNGGSGGSATPNGGSSGAGPTGCTRELLKNTLDAYFKALAAHDPSTLPLADTVKFTEDGEAFALGSKGLWKSAGALKYSHSALDTEQCQVASQGVVPDGTTDIPFALRLKLENQEITEIESIAVQKGDYSALASNTNAIIESATSVKWEDSVPEADRATRQELTSWIDKYFRMFPRGVCNTSSDCRRRENGGGNFNCSTGASCASGQPSASDNAMPSRLILADVERGIGVGFTMFQGTHTDMHMYKMYGEQVHAVYAVLAAADSSGWD